MIHFRFETNGYIKIKRNEISPTEIKLEFYGKDYNKRPTDHILINAIKYKGLVLPELFEYSTMKTDNAEYAYITNVNYISFNGTWHLKFTDDDVREILKRKLT